MHGINKWQLCNYKTEIIVQYTDYRITAGFFWSLTALDILYHLPEILNSLTNHESFLEEWLLLFFPKETKEAMFVSSAVSHSQVSSISPAFVCFLYPESVSCHLLLERLITKNPFIVGTCHHSNFTENSQT